MTISKIQRRGWLGCTSKSKTIYIAHLKLQSEFIIAPNRDTLVNIFFLNLASCFYVCIREIQQKWKTVCKINSDRTKTVWSSNVHRLETYHPKHITLNILYDAWSSSCVGRFCAKTNWMCLLDMTCFVDLDTKRH